MEAWEIDGYSALLISIIKEISIDKAFKAVRGYGGAKGKSKIKVNRFWTEEEIQILIRMIELGDSRADIAKAVKRTCREVSQKKSNLKVAGVL